jgi:hypothetical protein
MGNVPSVCALFYYLNSDCPITVNALLQFALPILKDYADVPSNIFNIINSIFLGFVNRIGIAIFLPLLVLSFVIIGLVWYIRGIDFLSLTVLVLFSVIGWVAAYIAYVSVMKRYFHTSTDYLSNYIESIMESIQNTDYLNSACSRYSNAIINGQCNCRLKSAYTETCS